MPHFTKTRFVYWNNDPQTLTSTNIKQKITIRNPNTNNSVNGGYAICSVLGDVHNWHQIPMEVFGWYCTPAQLASLYENFDSFWATNVKCTIAHCIPTAKYAGTTNATQLSFNNTIYSLTYVLGDTEQVTTSLPDADNISQNYDAFRTFDGSRFDNNERALLPKPTLYYKIPCDWPTGGDNYLHPNDTKYPLPATVDIRHFTSDGDLDPAGDIINDDKFYTPQTSRILTLQDLAVDLYPDPLLDNEGIKALYPGENQDVFEYKIEGNNVCKIDCRGQTFAETFWQLDHRNYGMNSNIVFDEKMLLNTKICPRFRGPIAFANKQGVSDTSEYRRHFTQDGWDIGEMFQESFPKWLVKGFPIIDPSNNNIPHSFAATCTWELQIEGIPRTAHIPRTLRWGHFYPEAIQYIKSVEKGKTVQGATQFYTKTWPKKPHNEKHMAGVARFQRPQYIQSATDTVQPTDLIYPLLPKEMPNVNPTDGWVAANYKHQCLTNEEFDPEYFIQPTRNRVPTHSFFQVDSTINFSQRRVTRSQTRKRKEFEQMDIDK